MRLTLPTTKLGGIWFDQGLEVLKLLLHERMGIEDVKVTPCPALVAKGVEREQIVNIVPCAFDPDGELGVDDVVPVLDTAKQLAVVGVISMDFVFRQNTGDIGPLFAPRRH